MSEPDEDVTVEERGVSVRKSLNDDQFETLAVVFDVRSSRDEASTVTLVDTVPDDVPVDDVGFHPEYGGEHWHADGGEVVFSRTFEPGEQYTTVYGVRDFDGDRAGLLAEPVVEIGTPEVGADDADEAAAGGPVRDVDAIDALVSEEDSHVVREVISGERDTLPGLEGSAGAGASADAGAPAGGEPLGADEAPGGPADGDEPAEVEAAAGPADADDDQVVEVDLPEPGETGAGADGPAGAAFGDDGEDVADDEGIEAELDEDDGLDDEISDLGTEEPAEAAPETVLGADEADADADDAPEFDEGIASLGTDEPAGEAAEADGEAAMDDEIEEPPTVDSEEDEVAADEETAAEGADEAETGVGAVMTDVGGDVAPAEEEAATAGGSDDESADDDPEGAEASPDDDEITVPVTGGIARVLAKELRAGNVSYEDRRLLREELLPDDGSTDARIQHLQNQVADLEAYTEALEQFLDEEGGAQAALSRVEERVDSIAEDVEAVEESLAGVDDTVEAVRDDVADVEEEVDEVEEEVEAVDAQVSTVSGDVERVAEDVERVDDDLADVRDDVRRIDDIDRRLDDFEDDVSAIQDELEELATFRERLSSVFGPGGMGGAGGGEGDEESED